MVEIIKGMKLHVVEQFTRIHNYIDLDAMILRKGAVSAREGEKLLIPINMRDGSLICIGKGNDDWNQSAPPNELYCKYMGEDVTFYAGISKRSRPCNYLDQDGDIVYGFNCFADLQVYYSINFPELLTVSERDTTLLTFEKEMQNYLNGLSEDKIKNGNIKKKLIKKANKLAKSLFTKNMQLLSCEISFVEIY